MLANSKRKRDRNPVERRERMLRQQLWFQPGLNAAFGDRRSNSGGDHLRLHFTAAPNLHQPRRCGCDLGSELLDPLRDLRQLGTRVLQPAGIEEPKSYRVVEDPLLDASQLHAAWWGVRRVHPSLKVPAAAIQAETAGNLLDPKCSNGGNCNPMPLAHAVVYRDRDSLIVLERRRWQANFLIGVI